MAASIWDVILIAWKELTLCVFNIKLLVVHVSNIFVSKDLNFLFSYSCVQNIAKIFIHLLHKVREVRACRESSSFSFGLSSFFILKLTEQITQKCNIGVPILKVVRQILFWFPLVYSLPFFPLKKLYWVCKYIFYIFNIHSHMLLFEVTYCTVCVVFLAP
jgi:hypothetical protein